MRLPTKSLKGRESEEATPKRLPTKRSDLWRFAILCLLKNFHFNNVLRDLGINFNVLSYSIFKKLGLGDLEPTKYLLQFANGLLE